MIRKWYSSQEISIRVHSNQSGLCFTLSVMDSSDRQSVMRGSQRETTPIVDTTVRYIRPGSPRPDIRPPSSNTLSSSRTEAGRLAAESMQHTTSQETIVDIETNELREPSHRPMRPGDSRVAEAGIITRGRVIQRRPDGTIPGYDRIRSSTSSSTPSIHSSSSSSSTIPSPSNDTMYQLLRESTGRQPDAFTWLDMYVHGRIAAGGDQSTVPTSVISTVPPSHFGPSTSTVPSTPSPPVFVPPRPPQRRPAIGTDDVVVVGEYRRTRQERLQQLTEDSQNALRVLQHHAQQTHSQPRRTRTGDFAVPSLTRAPRFSPSQVVPSVRPSIEDRRHSRVDSSSTSSRDAVIDLQSLRRESIRDDNRSSSPSLSIGRSSSPSLSIGRSSSPSISISRTRPIIPSAVSRIEAHHAQQLLQLQQQQLQHLQNFVTPPLEPQCVTHTLRKVKKAVGKRESSFLLAARRVIIESRVVNRSPPIPNVHAAPRDDNVLLWSAVAEGSNQFEGGTFFFDLFFPLAYPIGFPKIVCTTHIAHPHVSCSTGVIDVLKVVKHNFNVDSISKMDGCGLQKALRIIAAVVSGNIPNEGSKDWITCGKVFTERYAR